MEKGEGVGGEMRGRKGGKRASGVKKKEEKEEDEGEGEIRKRGRGRKGEKRMK